MSGEASGWKDAKEAIGCAIWIVVFFVVIPAVFVAGPKFLDWLEGWQP